MEEIDAADLDDILDSALEEFENEELVKISQEAVGRSGSDERIDEVLKTQQRNEATAQLHGMISDLENPAHKDSLQSTFAHLSGVQEGSETVKDFLQHLRHEETSSAQGHRGAEEPEQTPFEHGGASEVDRSVAQTLEMLAESAKDMEGMNSAQVEATGEEMMNNMIAEFEKLGEKEDFSTIVDGMMRQLLGKELMYEPMKQVCEKYPEWLAVQVDSLPKEEYERYGTQYQYFQRIVAVYETEPDNFPRIMELMHDVQQYGQPPAEIIKELAPGLEFNEEGMPIMPGMGQTTMPSQMPGMPGIPFPESAPDGQPCSVM